MTEPPPKQEPIPAEEPTPLDGWPIWTAVLKLLPDFQERWLAVALIVVEGNQDEAEVKRLQTLLWPFLVKRIVKREITATGFRSDPERRITIKPTFLQDAIPDWLNDTVSMGEIVFHGVRFSAADAPKDQSTIDAWMNQHARDTPKRDVALADCRAATGATWRDCLKAWNRLPAEVRGSRGVRKK